MGACIHTLAKDNCGKSLEYDKYLIAANFERKKPHMHRSFVKEVYINYNYDNGVHVVSHTYKESPA